MNRTIALKPSLLVRMATLAAGTAWVSTLAAQTPSWFPLAIGNTWLYRAAATNNSRPASDGTRTISVHGKETLAGKEYFDVTYFGREVVLREEPSTGSVFVLDRASGMEQPWLSLGLPVGGTFPTQINPCPTTAAIAARDASITVPAGQFANAVQVKFQGNCVDVGVTQQFYAPYIGLVSSEETSFAGPLRYELAYYRVDPLTGSAPEVSFTAATDSARYPADGTLQARLTLRSSAPDPIALHFPSGQSFDLKIRNEKGDIVFTWSAGRAFTLIIRDESFGPGEKTYGLTAPLSGLPPGHYTAEIYLTTDPIKYVSQVAFDIVG